MMYRHLANLCAAQIKWYGLYPDGPGRRFRLDPDEIGRQCSKQTKIIFLNSPSNPTGCVLTREEVKAVCEIANRIGAFVVSDEIYDQFVYDGDYASPVSWAERVVQLGGFSKTWAVPGWRLGWAAGPAKLLEAMKTLQQFTFVCAPAPLQCAVLAAAFAADLDRHVVDYRHKRDLIAQGLHPAYGLHPPEGSFYAFPSLPGGVQGDRFLEAAVEQKLLVVPGNAFSQRDTHFRLSFAASDEVLRRGIAALNRLAEQFA
jgi:aspartate aminotransferase/aminotransferase